MRNHRTHQPPRCAACPRRGSRRFERLGAHRWSVHRGTGWQDHPRRRGCLLGGFRTTPRAHTSRGSCAGSAPPPWRPGSGSSTRSMGSGSAATVSRSRGTAETAAGHPVAGRRHNMRQPLAPPGLPPGPVAHAHHPALLAPSAQRDHVPGIFGEVLPRLLHPEHQHQPHPQPHHETHRHSPNWNPSFGCFSTAPRMRQSWSYHNPGEGPDENDPHPRPGRSARRR